jgi:hypothetical protein
LFNKKSKSLSSHYQTEMRRVTPIKSIAGMTKLLYKKGDGPREFVIHV